MRIKHPNKHYKQGRHLGDGVGGSGAFRHYTPWSNILLTLLPPWTIDTLIFNINYKKV